MPTDPPKIFISYSHDSPEHRDRVLALADRLRAEGVDAELDQYELNPPEGWPEWCEVKAGEADFVIVVATQTYRQRFERKSPAGEGLGVKWEAAAIRRAIYAAEGLNEKYLPVVFSGADQDNIPEVLRGNTFFDISTDAGYQNLYRQLTDQPAVEKPELGKLIELPARPRRNFAPDSDVEIVRDRRDRLVAEMTAALGKSNHLIEALASCHEEWREKDEACLADAILATDVVKVLTRLNTLHARFCREKPSAASEVEEIVALIAPVLVQSRVIHALPNQTGGVWLHLPVQTETLAELAVAGFDGRPSALKSEGDYPEGIGRLPLPPESGFDVEGQVSMQDYARHFEQELLAAKDRRQVERLRSLKGDEKARDLAFGLVDDEFDFQAEFGDPPLRRYLLYDNQFARDHGPFLDRFRRRIESIHLVEMAGEDVRGERRISRPLREILVRAARTRETASGGHPKS